MKIDTENMGAFEARKVGWLLGRACDLDMDITGYGEVAVQGFGNTYLWLEDYTFTLYYPINATEDDCRVLWSNPENGEEHIEDLSEFDNLSDIYAWVERLENTSDEDDDIDEDEE